MPTAYSKYGSEATISGAASIAYNAYFWSADVSLANGQTGGYYDRVQLSYELRTNSNFAANDAVYVGIIPVKPDGNAIYPAALTSASGLTTTAATVAALKDAEHTIASQAIQAASETVKRTLQVEPQATTFKMGVWCSAASTSAAITGMFAYWEPVESTTYT